MRDGGGGVRVGGGVGGWGEGWGGETVLKGKVNLYEPGRIIIFQYLIYKKNTKTRKDILLSILIRISYLIGYLYNLREANEILKNNVQVTLSVLRQPCLSSGNLTCPQVTLFVLR